MRISSIRKQLVRAVFFGWLVLLALPSHGICRVETGEDIAAKAAAAMMAKFKSERDILSAEICVPAKFHQNTLSFETWPHARPPAMASLIHKKGGHVQLRFHLDHTLDFSQVELELKVIDPKAQ